MANISILIVFAMVLALSASAAGTSRPLVPLSNRKKFRSTVRDTDIPELSPDDYTVHQGAALQCFDVTSNDYKADGTLQVGELPHNGHAEVQDGKVCYKPDAYFNGYDQFTYSVTDGAYYNWAVIRIYVIPQYVPPTAVPDEASVSVGQHVLINVLSNDYDGDGLFANPKSLRILEDPAHGTAYVTPNHQIYYQPSSDPTSRFYGQDTLVYEICDVESSTACTYATVTITVNDECFACEYCIDQASTNRDHARWISHYYQEDVISKIIA